MPAKKYLLDFVECRKDRLSPELRNTVIRFANHLTDIKLLPWAAIPNDGTSVDILWDNGDIYFDISVYGDGTYHGYCKITVEKYRHILLKYSTTVLTSTFEVCIDDRSVDLPLPDILRDVLLTSDL